MVRLVTIHVPIDKKGEVSPTLLSLSESQIYQLSTISADDGYQITFKCKDKHTQNVLEEINKTGCGRYYGHIDVMQVLLSRPAVSVLGAVSGKKKRQYKISERMTVDEINGLIDDGNHLTFNYMALLSLASVIAGTGLLTDSDTTVIASMLVSPLMGPILSITFGLAVYDIETIRRGLRNEVVGIFITMISGLIMGLIAAFIYPSDYRSEEMVTRGESINLIAGFIVAVASGAAVVVAVSMGGVNAIVGTAISASLLPPIVNSGICFSMSVVYRIHYGAHHNADQYAIFGANSFCLFVVNFISIVIVGYLTFRYIKDVKPEHKRAYSISETVDGGNSSLQLNALHDPVRNP